MCGVAAWRTIMSQRAWDSLGPIGSSLPSMKRGGVSLGCGKGTCTRCRKDKDREGLEFIEFIWDFFTFGLPCNLLRSPRASTNRSLAKYISSPR